MRGAVLEGGSGVFDTGFGDAVGQVELDRADFDARDFEHVGYQLEQALAIVVDLLDGVAQVGRDFAVDAFENE